MPTTNATPTYTHAAICRVRVVNGGYLDGIDIHPPPGASVLCGAPGVGKSTMLAVLRYVLMLAVPPSKKDPFEDLIANNLGAGRAYVTFVTAGGVQYTISRGGGDESTRYDAPESAVGTTFVPGQLISVQFVGHGEFDLLATDGLARLELLERFVSDDMRHVRDDLALVRKELDDNGVELVRLDREAEALTLKCLPLASDRAHLDELKKAAGGDPVDLSAADTREALRSRERLMLDKADEEIARLERELSIFVTTAKRKLEQAIDLEVLAHGPNAALLADVAAHLRQTRDVLDATGARVASECAEARRVFVERGRALAAVHAQQNDEYRALLSKREGNAGRARERLGLEKTVAELTKAKEELDARAQERAQHGAVRTALRGKHRALLLRRRSVLRGAADHVMEGTGKLVKIRIESEAERSKLRALIGELVKGKGFKGEHLDVVAAKTTGEDLAAQALAGDSSTLTEILGSKTVATRLVAELLESGRVYELETVEMEDVPIVQLLDNDTYKDSHTLSSGQRTIVFAAIALLDKRGPFVADQPEDNLANRYLAEHFSRAVRDAQGEMQFIFVTHNGNLPIIGQVQRVFELQADGKRGWVAAEGETAAVKEPMENNFEGGRGAFVVRRDFYGVE